MDKDANLAEPIEPQNKYAREMASLEDREQATTEKKTLTFLEDHESEVATEKKTKGEKERVGGPSPTKKADTKFCPLCNRFISPTQRNYSLPGVLFGTAIIGIAIASLQKLGIKGDYDYYTRTYTVTFTDAVLGGLLTFAQGMFVILFFASILWLTVINSQEKRCPICNAKLS